MAEAVLEVLGNWTYVGQVEGRELPVTLPVQGLGLLGLPEPLPRSATTTTTTADVDSASNQSRGLSSISGAIQEHRPGNGQLDSSQEAAHGIAQQQRIRTTENIELADTSRSHAGIIKSLLELLGRCGIKDWRELLKVKN
jgi:hypothetical protein